MALSRQYVKLCDLHDFEDHALRAMLRSVAGDGYSPEEERHRKFWEYAMLGLYLQEVGALGEGTEALAVAAGHEHPLYWLANRIARIVATDIYGEGDFATNEADGSMLSDPSIFAPYPYRTERLEVRSMNALELDFPDESFDVVFSLSSIEHFGGPREVAQASREMGRVLRPGGHLLIATEYLLRWNPLDSPVLQSAIRLATGGKRCSTATLRNRVGETFTKAELERCIVGPSGLRLVQSLDTRISPESFQNIFHPDAGKPQKSFPHIVLQARHGAPWTSVFLALSHGA
jgi:SAM-dependent methyltransferase